VNFLTKNLALKIIAFMLALMFWFNVVTNKVYEHEFSVPFEFEDIAEELILTTPPPENFKIKLEGTGKQILMFLLKKPGLHYDASKFERGVYVVEFSPSDFVFDDNIRVEIAGIVEPQSLTLKFEKLTQKTVNVMADIEITPALGYTKVGKLEVTPDSLLVWGPQRIIRSLKYLSTKNLSFKEVKKDIGENIDLALDDTLFLTPEVDFVTISQRIVPLTEKKVGPIGIQTYNSNRFDSAALTPDSIYVIIEGPRGKIDSLDLSLFAASVNFRNIDSGTSTVLPKIVIPPGYRLIGTDPASISVTAIQR